MAAMESSLANVKGEITQILMVVLDIKEHLDGETGSQTHPAANGIHPAEVDAAKRSQPGGRVRTEADQAGDGRGAKASLSISRKPPAVQTSAERGASPNHPLVVVDDASSGSESDKVADIRTPITPDGPGTRVHKNPRMRVVPYEGRLVPGRSESQKRKAVPKTEEQSPIRRTKYKDPPGYENLADFGTTSETQYKLPVLQPKKKPVSTPTAA
jgi:hypothetical protein